jgi:hypothetical protein
LISGLVQAKEYYGKPIGPITTYAHKVSGKVYAVDEDTLFIKDFTYDGLGPGESTYIISSCKSMSFSDAR